MVTSRAWPSRAMRPPRISSRISRVTYFPNVSLIRSRSRRPWSIRLKPSVTEPISSLVTTGQRRSRSPRATSPMARSSSRSGTDTLRATRSDRPAAARTPTPVMKSTTITIDSTIAAAATRSARMSACALVSERTPSSESGITLVSTKMMRSRARTGSRGTPRTALRSPSGKNRGMTWRHWCSAAKNAKAVATLPAMPVIPNICRSAFVAEKLPLSSGHPTPQMIPASNQPTRVSPATA